MKRLGKILHLSNTKHLILRTRVKTEPDTKVFDDHLNNIGKIREVFGPVTNPYISITPVVKNPEKYVGHILYIMN